MLRLLCTLVSFLALSCTAVEAQTDLDVTEALHFSAAADHLTRVQQLIADSEGGAWAIDSQIKGVLRFSASGELVTFGREGSGPGEFKRPWRLSLVRDTLWVTDIGLDRITGLDPQTGEPLGIISGFSLWRTLPLMAGQVVTPIGVTESGSVLVAIDEPESGSIALTLLTRSWPVRRHDVLRLQRLGDDLSIPMPGNDPPVRVTNPFSNADILTLDNYGRVVGRIRQEAAPEAELVSLDGAAQHDTIVWALERREVSGDEREAWLASEGWSSRFVRRGMFASMAAAKNAIDASLETALLPVLRRVTRGVFERTTFVDGEGVVWFEGWSMGRAPRKWYRLTAQGPELAFTLRDGELLLDVSGEFLWKQEMDSFGVPHISRVRLERHDS